ncbi:MAG: chorismate synthase [Methanomassiliicoccales archaeon]
MNTAGTALRITIFGESHGELVGAVLDGLPAGMPLDIVRIQQEIDMRRPAPLIGTARHESDIVEILTGHRNGKLTGTPLLILFRNTDVRSATYDAIQFVPRPGHADYTSFVKYGGFADSRGGGQFSGRMTAPLVAAGACARQFLEKRGIRVAAFVRSIHTIRDDAEHTFDEVEKGRFSNEIRCLDPVLAEKMKGEILMARSNGDSVGGIVECRASGMPAGLGDPFFDSVEGEISKMVFAIPAVRGIQFGSGFASTEMYGSEHNDQFTISEGKVVTLTNNAGGVNGGITNGMDIVFSVAFKPTSSIPKEQRSVDLTSMRETTIVVKGRHDPCIVPRAVIVVEAVCSLVLADLLLRGGLQ